MNINPHLFARLDVRHDAVYASQPIDSGQVLAVIDVTSAEQHVSCRTVRGISARCATSPLLCHLREW